MFKRLKLFLKKAEQNRLLITRVDTDSYTVEFVSTTGNGWVHVDQPLRMVAIAKKEWQKQKKSIAKYGWFEY